ncbi:unnamed protein product [Rotaria magnacalcarata]|uniref:Uncharacterized protein n=1 Tax=Rotaria magnacalcarata TaxID=392030 RepID=A0A8S3DJG0_9BILA|nr:unnamed protein product [Rotaria magnacalcarata]
MRDSYKRVDRLVNCFPQKKTPIKRNRLQQNDLDDKESNSLKEEQQLKEKLCLFISYIKQLKEQRLTMLIIEYEFFYHTNLSLAHYHRFNRILRFLPLNDIQSLSIESDASPFQLTR